MMLTIILSIEIVVILIELFYIFIFYKGKVEGNILDCQTMETYNDGHRNLSFRYTISYLVNGQTFIYQQKLFSTKLKNPIIIKYNIKNPKKSRIKGENPILFLAIVLLFITIMAFL